MDIVVKRLRAAGGFVIAFIFLMGLQAFFPGFYDFYSPASRWMMTTISSVTGPFPVALWELFAVAIVIWAVVSFGLAFYRKNMRQWLSGALLGVVGGAFVFVALWGLNYFGPSIQEKMDFPVGQYTLEELKTATGYYFEMANQYSTQVPRDIDGIFAPGDFDALASQASKGFQALSVQYDCFDGSNQPVKKLLSSKIYGKMGITGIFIDFTAESCVSTLTHATGLPFTMCHEMAHRMAFAPENEANFAAFLACVTNQNEVFNYSGYYEAFTYCYNALYKADPNAAKALWQKATPQLTADCNAAWNHYQTITNPTAEKVSTAVNDTYLRTFAQPSGVQSYGEVTDLLIAWYKNSPQVVDKQPEIG